MSQSAVCFCPQQEQTNKLTSSSMRYGETDRRETDWFAEGDEMRDWIG